MKSIDELRNHMKFMCDHGLMRMEMDTVNTHLSEIEHELEEGYVELPKDADGKPIRVGDVMEFDSFGTKKRRYVKAVGIDTFAGYETYPSNIDKLDMYVSSEHRHQPQTTEDVLREFAKSIAETLGGDEFLLRDDDEMYAKFAERLQLREGE